MITRNNPQFFARMGLIVAVSGVIGGTLLDVFGSHLWGLDDAYISYRYARNFASGIGLVFNAGEYVEGFSNPLYTLLLAFGLHFVAPPHVYALSIALNIGFIVAAVIVLYAIVYREAGRTAATASAILFAYHPEVWSSTASGLETPLVLLLHMLLWLSAVAWRQSNSSRVGILFGTIVVLEVWNRVDGFVMPLVAIMFLALGRCYLRAMVGLGVLSCAMASLTAWRLAYYGQLLPNTYYTKVTGRFVARFSHAASQLLAASLYQGLLPYILISFLAIGVLVFAVRYRRLSVFEDVGMPMCIIVTSLAYWMAIGGDVLGIRFLLPVIPASSALFFLGTRRWHPRWQIAGTFLILTISALHVIANPSARYPFEKRDGWLVLGEFLRDKHPGATLAIDAVGKVPYFSELMTIDMLGLADAHIARTKPRTVPFLPGHMKWDGQYVLSRKPDLIAAFVLPSGNMPQVGITASDYLAAGYRPKYLVSPSENPPPLIVDLDTLPTFSEKEWREFLQNDFDYLVVYRDR